MRCEDRRGRDMSTSTRTKGKTDYYISEGERKME